MAPRKSLCSSSFKVSEDLATLKGNKTLLGGSENPSPPESWVVPAFFEDYMFD